MNIQQILSMDGRVNLTVTALELKEFGLSLIKEARKLGAEEAEQKAQAKDRLITSAEACKRLRISQSTLGNYRRSKALTPVKKVGSRYMYRLMEVENFARYYDMGC